MGPSQPGEALGKHPCSQRAPALPMRPGTPAPWNEQTAGTQGAAVPALCPGTQPVSAGHRRAGSAGTEPTPNPQGTKGWQRQSCPRQPMCSWDKIPAGDSLHCFTLCPILSSCAPLFLPSTNPTQHLPASQQASGYSRQSHFARPREPNSQRSQRFCPDAKLRDYPADLTAEPEVAPKF